jgi:hypothetical protein
MNRRFGHQALLLAISLLLFSCNHSKSIQTDLYFGLSKPDGEVSAEEWTDFREKVLNKTFEGFSEIDCNGHWTGKNGNSVSEKSKLIVIIHPDKEGIDKKVDSVISIYKRRFEQESVLRVDKVVEIK